MKKTIIAIALAAFATFAIPTSVKAATALDIANNFNNTQYNFMTAQNSYFNTYQMPVMQVYDQAMSNQISQALAAQYQSLLMRQQALQREDVNRFQIANNLDADIRNFNTQVYTIGSNLSYNSGMQFVNLNQANLAYGANTLAYFTGQYQPFPQVP